jgi:hypothetical protein
VLLEGNGTGLSGNYIRMRTGPGGEGKGEGEGEIRPIILSEQNLVGGE